MKNNKKATTVDTTSIHLSDVYENIEHLKEIGICESFDDLRRPLDWGADSYEGVPLVIRNLELIASLLCSLSKRYDKMYGNVDPVEVIGLNHILSYYADVLPQVLKEQIEALGAWLPTGDIQDCGMRLRAADEVFSHCPKSQKTK